MAMKDGTKATKAQLDRVAKLGQLGPNEPRAPRGLSPLDTGKPPCPKASKAALEAERKAEGKEGAEAPEKKAHEAWALELGYLPARWRNPAAVRNARLRAVAPTANPKHWIYAGALARHRWPLNAEMTRAEFEHALAVAHDFTIRA